MPQIHTLTVQDVLWIHSQLTRRVEPFRYAAIEEATFAQYSYGVATDIPAAATRLLRSFVVRRPFDSACEALSFVVPLAFLHLNGYRFGIPDDEALGWFVQTVADEGSGIERVRSAVTPEPHGAAHEASVPETVRSIIARYPLTIRGLLESDDRAA